MKKDDKNCPGCENHCPPDALKCEKGEEHFGLRREKKDIGSLPVEEQILVLLRQCGHHLHHNVQRDTNAASLMDGLTTEEKTALASLLQKCLRQWQN